jgi:O-antigen ligase
MTVQVPPPVIVMQPASPNGYRLLPPELLHSTTSRLTWPLLGVLMFAPLAFGATEPWSLAVLQGSACAIFLAWMFGQIRSAELVVRPHPLFGPVAAFGAVVVVQLAAGLTSYWFATYEEALKLAAYGMLFFIATQVIRGETSKRRFAMALAVFGGTVALFALLQDLTSDGLLYWLRKPRFGGTIYGPYVNRNHYAGLMEMLTPLPLLLACSPWLKTSQRVLLGGAGALMASTIVLSGSRGGMLALFAELVFMGMLIGARERSREVAIAAAIFLLAFVGLLFWLDATPALQHWSYLRVEEEATVGRWAITRDALTMWMEKPLLGSGLGTFPVVYPQYRSFYTNFFVNEAHNDVAQVLVETGIAGGVAMIWFVIAVYRSALRQRPARSQLRNAVQLAALTGCTGLLVHSCFDFNLHIPANAAMFFVLAAVAAQRPEAR